MFAANPVEAFVRRAAATARKIIQTLADAFFRICAGGNVEQPQEGFGILHDSGCLTVSTTGRLLFLRCFTMLAKWRRKVVSD